MKHFGEKVNLWVQYRCSLSHTPFSCSLTDSLLWRFPCHCIHTYISLRPKPPPPPPPEKKRKSTRLNFPFPWLPCDKSKPFQGNKYWLTSSKAEAYPGKTSEKCTPPPPPPRRPSGQSIGLAIRLPGSNPALATGWISSCSQLFSSSHPWPCLVIANWLPPASWGF